MPLYKTNKSQLISIQIFWILFIITGILMKIFLKSPPSIFELLVFFLIPWIIVFYTIWWLWENKKNIKNIPNEDKDIDKYPFKFETSEKIIDDLSGMIIDKTVYIEDWIEMLFKFIKENDIKRRIVSRVWNYSKEEIEDEQYNIFKVLYQEYIDIHEKYIEVDNTFVSQTTKHNKDLFYDYKTRIWEQDNQ